MKKQILCYTDFSENALNAINYAIKLYEQQSCVFYILNAFQADKKASDIKALVPEPGNKTYEMAKKTSEAGLKNIIDTLNSNSKNTKHTYKTISNFNALLYALKDTIKNKAINLLVIGSKGTLDLEKEDSMPTLNTMEYITECPILAVPGGYTFLGLKNMVLPVDYKEAVKKANFTEMVDIYKLHHPEIHLVHVKNEFYLNDSQLENKTFLESILKGLKYSFHTLKFMSINKGIDLFIEKKQCDLIIFIDERSNYIGNELPKYLLNQLESQLPIPVLTLNIKVSEKKRKKRLKLI